MDFPPFLNLLLHFYLFFFQSLYTGNEDAETYVAYRLKSKIEQVQYIRMIPLMFEGQKCFRFELFGCDGGNY